MDALTMFTMPATAIEILQLDTDWCMWWAKELDRQMLARVNSDYCAQLDRILRRYDWPYGGALPRQAAEAIAEAQAWRRILIDRIVKSNPYIYLPEPPRVVFP